MAKKQYKVTTVDGKVRVDMDDGTHTDFLPGEANKLAGMLVAAAHEAVFNYRPPAITMTFGFEN